MRIGVKSFLAVVQARAERQLATVVEANVPINVADEGHVSAAGHQVSRAGNAGKSMAMVKK